jgi:hypothetical protein
MKSNLKRRRRRRKEVAAFSYAKCGKSFLSLYSSLALHGDAPNSLSPPPTSNLLLSLSLSFIRPLSFEAAGIVNKTVVAGAILI